MVIDRCEFHIAQLYSNLNFSKAAFLWRAF